MIEIKVIPIGETLHIDTAKVLVDNFIQENSTKLRELLQLVTEQQKAVLYAILADEPVKAITSGAFTKKTLPEEPQCYAVSSKISVEGRHYNPEGQLLQYLRSSNGSVVEKKVTMELTYLYLLPVTIVVAWIVAFIAAGRYRLPGDRIFLAFLTAGGITLFVTQHLIQSVYYDNLFFAFTGLELLFEMSICPLLFIYMRSVARDVRWHNWYLWLFVPAMLSCMDVFVFHLIEGDIYYYVTIVTMETVMTAMSIYYLVRYQRHSEDYFANIEDSSSDKIRNVLVFAIILMLSMIIVSGLYNYISDIKGFLLIRSLWLSAVVWMIASNAYKIKTILPPLIEEMEELDEETTKDDETGDLSNVETDEELANKITAWIGNPDKSYCKEGLTIVDMAEQIDEDPRAISAYIKRSLSDSPNRKNFSHWINILRIEEAKRLLCTYPDYKINHISSLCGYPTQSTFSRAFQQIVGQSPRSYREICNEKQFCNEKDFCRK